MPHLPLAYHETSKCNSPNETKVKEKQNETIPDLNSNLAKSMTHHNQTKELITWFLKSPPTPGGRPGATGHVEVPEPRRAVVLVPWSHGDVGAFSYRVTGLVPRGTWQHQSPLLASGAHGALGHVATLEPFPGGWLDPCDGAHGDTEPSSSRWFAMCLRARGGARALWHRERIWSLEDDLFSLMHRGTRSVGYRQWPSGPPQER
jgi:hypothetical protein